MPPQLSPAPSFSALPNRTSSQDEVERNRSLVEYNSNDCNDDGRYELMAQQSAEAWLTRKNNTVLPSTAALYMSHDDDDENSPFIEAQISRKESLRERLQKRLSIRSSREEQTELEPDMSASSGSSEDTAADEPPKDEDECIVLSHVHEVTTLFSDSSSTASSGVREEEEEEPRVAPPPPPPPPKRNMILPALLGLGHRLRTGSQQQQHKSPKKFNLVRLHIYDLMASETVMQLPWGCHFPIGKCLSAVNDGLHALGTGAYHCGVEVNGIEYAFGANEMEGLSGVFTCIPKHSPGYEYRTTLDFGQRETTRRTWIKVPKVELVEIPFVENRSSNDAPPPVEVNASTVYRDYETFVHGHAVMREMSREYMGCDYDLLKRNCCTFARDACLRLGVRKSEIPTWFLNLAETGAVTKDMASNSLKPLQKMLSFHESQQQQQAPQGQALPTAAVDRGFEVICQEKDDERTEMEIVKVVESMAPSSKQGGFGIRRTRTFTY